MNTSVIGKEGGKPQENVLLTDADVDYIICSLVKVFQVVHLMYLLLCIPIILQKKLRQGN